MVNIRKEQESLNLEDEYCMVKATVTTILKNKEALKGSDMVKGV